MIGKVERYLVDRIREKGVIHLTLIDPVKIGAKNAINIASEAEEAGSSGIMLGGSIGVEQTLLDSIIKKIKENCKIPIILFPGSLTGLSRYADAVWFMSLLNSQNPYYIIHAQMTGAPIVKMYGLEPLPMGYIIFEPGEAAGFVGMARLIPRNKWEIAVAYALAAQYLGMRFVYLEAGSGSPTPIPAKVVKAVKQAVDIHVIVGGGIKTEADVASIVRAGADVFVTGTLTESRENVKNVLKNLIIRAEREAGYRAP